MSNNEKLVKRQFNDQTKQTILQRMLDNSPDDIDKRQGSVTYDLLSPNAIESEMLYIQLDNVLKFGFVNEDQPIEYLKLRAAEQGIEQKKSTKAEGEVSVTGPEGEIVSQGQRFYTDDDIYFEITESAEIENEEEPIKIKTKAVEAGSDGNVGPDEIVNVAGDLSGVITVTNEEAFEGGTDDESFDDLMFRYFEKVRRPSTSGNIYHYVEWATEVEGVSRARVFPLHEGPGTVRVVIVDEERRKPDQIIIDNTQDYIDPNSNGEGEGQAPIGASVTVEGAIEVNINVTAEVKFREGGDLNEVKEEFEEKLTEYIKERAFPSEDEKDEVDEVIRYSRIANLLLDVSDVLDYNNLTVNNGTSNIETEEDEVPVPGEVTLNEITE